MPASPRPSLHAREDGPPSAPCVVLLAGLGMGSLDWPDGLVEGLASDFRVLRFDNRDAGLSPRCGADPDPDAVLAVRSANHPHPDAPPYDLGDMALDVLAALDARGIARFSLIGFSMGGMIAQKLALAAPDRVAALVLVSTAARPGPFAPKVHERFVRMGEPFGDAAALRAWLDADIAFFHAPCVPAPADRRRMVGEMLAAGLTQGGFARQYRAILATAGWSAGLRRLACPALVLCGGGDVCLPPQHARALGAALSGAEVRIVDGVGHSLEPALWLPILDWMRCERQAGATPGHPAG